MQADNHINIIKLDIDRIEKWRYPGKVLKRTPHWLVLEAVFDRPDVEFFGLQLARGDRFVEIYFQNRWFNINAIAALKELRSLFSNNPMFNILNWIENCESKS